MGVADLNGRKNTPVFRFLLETQGFIGFGDDVLKEKKKATPIGMTFLLVREAGLEPARPQ